MAAATFFCNRISVTELSQAERMLHPLLGDTAAQVFALALLLAGIASSITAGMAGGSIVAGMFGEPFNSNDRHTRLGIALTLLLGAVAIFFVQDTFKGLIFSQVLLSLQLPWTIFLQIYLTSSKKVMGSHANRPFGAVMLWGIAAIVTALNIMLLLDYLR
jgi:manganese transport protein